MKRILVSALPIALATATATGCAHRSTTPGATMMQASTASCPLAQLYDVTETITEVPSGVALTFVAPEEEREKLREAIRDMATPKEGMAVDAFAGCPCASLSPPAPPAERATSVIPPLPLGPQAQGQPPGGGASTQAQPLVFDTVAREDDTATGAILLLRTLSADDATALITVLRDKMAALRQGCR